jgi:uncharacterized membrane protein YphA (DoxX/SURF4 family)
MNSANVPAASWREITLLLLRWALGGIFIYLGLSKALHPVEFLKILREFQITSNPFWLNLIAAALPWFEVFCGLLLVTGIAVRGSALVCVTLLVPFTWAVLRRALAIHELRGIPLCAVRFDCGCGAGEVMICRKLIENSGLVAASVVLVMAECRRWTLRFDLLNGVHPKDCRSPESLSKGI